MPTSVHIPADVLTLLDRKAKALGLSRNRLIVRAVEKEVSNINGWSDEFFTTLAENGPKLSENIDQLVEDIHAQRRSKPPIQL